MSEPFFNLFYTIDNTLDKIKMPIYYLLIGTLYMLYFVLFVGIFYVDAKYIQLVNNSLQLFVCLFLMYRFFPLRKHELHKYDSNIIFSCAVLLLINTGIGQLIKDDFTIFFTIFKNRL